MSRKRGDLRVEMKVGFKTKQHGRKVLKPQLAEKCYQGPRQSISRQARLLALAHRWQRLLDEGQIESQGEIARVIGLSRARVSQIMDLRWLSPCIQKRILAKLPETCSPADVLRKLPFS